MELNKYIDHTLLKPASCTADFKKLCEEALEHEFFSVCVPPALVEYCAKLLKNSDVAVCTVAGFPTGYETLNTKLSTAEEVLKNGATEIDMVQNIILLKDKKYAQVENEIKKLKALCGKNILKVIVETDYLTREEKETCVKLCEYAGADFIKTSTGFAGGAQIEDVKLWKPLITGGLKVKASGGIKTAEQAKAFIEAGASRLGTSSGIAISS